MLKTALIHVLEELYSLSPERNELRKKSGPFETLLKSRQLVIDNPELLAFYFRHRKTPDVIGKTIQDFEMKYLAAVSEQTGLKNPANLLFVRTIIHGISVAPFLSDSQVKDCLVKLEAIIRQ